MRVVVHASDGFPVTAWHAPGRSPQVLYAHATGFCGAVWRPVRTQVDLASTVFDFRGHGASRSNRDRWSWWEMARDVLAVRTAADGSVIGVGHSMGGAALAMAEVLRPGTFDALVLVEPIILPGSYGRDPDHPLVSLALRRRVVFESREDARLTYSSKPPFDAWDDAALDGYLDGGFHASGESITLACRPHAEAGVFSAAGAHAAWERLDEISCPVSILYGEHTDTYPPGHADRLATRFRDAEAHMVAGTGHFVPMEQPAVVAAAVNRMALS